MDESNQSSCSRPTQNNQACLCRVAHVLAAAPVEKAESILANLPDSQAAAIRGLMPIANEASNENVHRSVLDLMKQIPQSALFTAIVRERPQTIAILLSVLPPQLSPRIVLALSESRRTEVINRLSRLGRVSQEIIDTLLIGLKQRIEKVCTNNRSQADGLQTVASILKACDRDTESSILTSLGKHDQKLTGEIQQMLFSFDDIANLTNAEIQSLTRNVHVESWAMALKRTERNVRDRVFANLSPRAAQHVRAEMNYLGQTTPSEIDRAQNEIVNVARHLQEPATIRRAA